LITKKLYDFFDAKGVRVFVGYGASGGYSVVTVSKHTPREFIRRMARKW
jgi:long-subunit acyl-CoA synthetase (AMP-forming)